MGKEDPPQHNLRKAIRDATSLHRRLSWIPDCDAAKLHLIECKNALVAQYEALGGEFADRTTFPQDEPPHSLAGPKRLPVEQENAGSNPAAGTT